MRILVAVATKHGATREIADEVGATLRERLGPDATVDVLAPGGAGAVSAYDAVILGSSVHMGHWMAEATDFLHRNQEALRAVPVWLFSSGPVGSPPKPEGEPLEAATLGRLVRAKGHRVFAGRLDRHGLGLGERVVVTAVHAPEGDYRDWADVRSWAESIATTLAGNALHPRDVTGPAR